MPLRSSSRIVSFATGNRVASASTMRSVCMSDHRGPSAFFKRTLIQRLVSFTASLTEVTQYERDGRLHHNDGRKCREQTGQSGPPQSTTESTVGWVHHGSQHRRQNEGGGKRPGNPQLRTGEELPAGAREEFVAVVTCDDLERKSTHQPVVHHQYGPATKP